MDVSDDDDMAAVMGFSSFSEMPKPKRQKVDEKPSKLSSNNPNAIPLGKRMPKERQAAELEPIQMKTNQPTTSLTSDFAGQMALPLGRPSALGSNSTNHGDSSTSSASYKGHPVLEKALDQLTFSDLELLRHGVRAADGRIIYFSKGFIEDPWEQVKER
jgi:hypothetical protein